MAAVAVPGACGGNGQGGTGASPQPSATVPAPTPSTETAPPDAGSTPPGEPAPEAAEVTLTTVARLDEPIRLLARPADGALVVVERGGRVLALDPAGGDPVVLLDIRDLTAPGGERGLLDVAYAPDGAHLYVSYTDTEGSSNLDEYAVTDDGLGVDAGSRRQVLHQEQPFPNHNGGGLAFGPDGALYLGFGDGGSGGDPLGSGQDLSTLLGKILRIDPRPAGGDPYGIPADNPFVGRAGARGEIWLYGVRNPWRFSFDPATGDLWVADVGQDRYEEIDLLPSADSGGRGANLGWNLFEGDQPFEAAGAADGLVMPLATYEHGDLGCSVTGGVVYRGAAIPALQGAYLFSDYCAGGVRALVPDGRGGADVSDLGVAIPSVVSFGVDADGEVYVLSLDGEIARLDPA